VGREETKRIIDENDLKRKYLRELIDLVEAYFKTVDRQLVEERKKDLEAETKSER